MEIEYAKAMTSEEIIEHNNFIYSKHNKLKCSASNILNSKRDDLIRLYLEKEKEIIAENKNHALDYSTMLSAWNNNKCICGADLMQINGNYGPYWDCKDKINSNVKHKNYVNWVANDYPQPRLYKSSIPKTYIFDIIKENGYKGDMNAKALLQFYIDLGLPDLKVKYCGQSSFDHINTYIKVKEVSDAFEKECVDRLKSLYTTVLPQFHVKYKLKGGSKYIVKKLDILCSNDKEVAIYECKTNVHDMDELQKDTYIAIIKHINRNNCRPVNFRYLIDTERDSYGFKKIEHLEMQLSKGKYYGYPQCCIDSFLNKKHTDRQSEAGYSTGFVPCEKCCDKLIKPRDLEKLLVNRFCEEPFPGEGIPGDDYAATHRQAIPEYYL